LGSRWLVPLLAKLKATIEELASELVPIIAVHALSYLE
jgi:hypothetical protein